MAEERRKSEELAGDDEQPDTARRIDDGSGKEVEKEEAAEKEKMENESERKQMEKQEASSKKIQLNF